MAGAAHTFLFGGRPIEIRLPPRPKRERKGGGSWGDDRIWCSSWRTASERPLCFDVLSLDVFVDLKKPLGVPAESLGHVKLDHFSKGQRARFEKLAEQGEALATDALEHWLRVLRWKSLRPHIGRPQTSRGPLHGVYLVDYSSKRRFYAGPISITAGVSCPLSKRIWHRTATALAQALEPPIWFDFLFEGEHRVASGDLSGSVIHLAIAAESLLREIVARKHAKTPVDEEFRALLNQVSISRIVDRWKHLRLHQRSRAKAIELPAFKRLFELRNRLMHRGDGHLDAAECRSLAKAVRTLLLCAG